jgi:hypothetical protein
MSPLGWGLTGAGVLGGGYLIHQLWKRKKEQERQQQAMLYRRTQ